MAIKFTRYKIRVNSISPGYIITPSLEGADVLPTWLTMMPEGARLGKPEDLISAYAYFVSDGSSFTTGTDLIVDGCYTAL